LRELAQHSQDKRFFLFQEDSSEIIFRRLPCDAVKIVVVVTMLWSVVKEFCGAQAKVCLVEVGYGTYYFSI